MLLIGGNVTLNNTHKSESNLLVEIINFRKNTKAKIPEKKAKKKKNILKAYMHFLMIDKRFLMPSKSNILIGTDWRYSASMNF